MTRDAGETLGRLRNDQMGVVFRTDVLGLVSSTVEAAGGVPTALTVLRDVFNLASQRGWRER
jgi:homoserine dehydrogenase